MFFLLSATIARQTSQTSPPLEFDRQNSEHTGSGRAGCGDDGHGSDARRTHELLRQLDAFVTGTNVRRAGSRLGVTNVTRFGSRGRKGPGPQ